MIDEEYGLVQEEEDDVLYLVELRNISEAIRLQALS